MHISHRLKFPLYSLGSLVGALAFCSLAVAQPANMSCTSSCDVDSCTFQEILNLPLGNATLSLNNSCQLVIDGISGSGQDGVVQTELGSLYMKTMLATPNFSGSIAGTSADIRQVGIASGVPDTEIMLTRLVNFDGANIRHVVDCSFIVVAGYTLDIYDGIQLVEHQELGVDPPLLIYPKGDLLSLACGIRPNGDVYSVFELGASLPITVLTSPTDPGPFTGNVGVVVALSPQSVPTLQTDIENNFFATGPVTLESIEAGSLPGSGLPCSGDCSTDLAGGDRAVRNFMQAGANALLQCAGRGQPPCPAPCPEYPSLNASGLSPSCYNLTGCYLDELMHLSASEWGADRCPDAAADTCGLARGQEGADLMQQIFKRHRLGQESKIAPDVAACHDTLQGFGCPSDICDEIQGWVEAILGLQ